MTSLGQSQFETSPFRKLWVRKGFAEAAVDTVEATEPEPADPQEIGDSFCAKLEPTALDVLPGARSSTGRWG